MCNAQCVKFNARLSGGTELALEAHIEAKRQNGKKPKTN
jgi:hypothetical protein